MINSSTEFLVSKPPSNLEDLRFFGKFWDEEGTVEVYDEFFKREKIEYDVVKHLISSLVFDSVYEMGCGDARFSKPLFTNKKYSGIDISNLAIKRAKESYPKDNFLCGDFLKEKPVNADLIIAIAVLDSVYNIDLTLQKMRNMANKYVIFTTHYPLSKTNEHDQLFNDRTQAYTNRLSMEKIARVFPDMKSCQNGSVIVWQWERHHNDTD